MASINPYLNFKDNTEEAFNFYKSVFGGEFQMVMRFKDMDMPSEQPMSESAGNKIAHISLPMGKGTMLMGSDTPEGGLRYSCKGPFETNININYLSFCNVHYFLFSLSCVFILTVTPINKTNGTVCTSNSFFIFGSVLTHLLKLS